MPRRTLITALERTSLLSVPADRDTLIRHYTFSPEELVWINSRREDFNRLGFAVQLSYMKYPGIVLDAGATPDENLLGYVRACPKFPVFQNGRFSRLLYRPLIPHL